MARPRELKKMRLPVKELKSPDRSQAFDFDYERKENVRMNDLRICKTNL
jgi:hypothetical protein